MKHGFWSNFCGALTLCSVPGLEGPLALAALRLTDTPRAEAQVGAMDPVRPDPTDRARALSVAVRVDAHYLDIHVHRQHRDVCNRREQQLLQPEHDLFHGPEPSAQRTRPQVIFRRLDVPS